MNAIPKLKTFVNSTLSGVETSVYYYILSRCTVDQDGDVISSVTTESIKRAFAITDNEELDDLIETLYELNLIEEEDGTIYVGYQNEDKTIVLYADDMDSKESRKIFSDILTISQSYKNSAKMFKSRAHASDCFEILTDFEEKKIAEFNTRDLLSLFNTCSEVILQEDHREITKAEAGAMKKFLIAVGSVKAVPIIINYCINFSRWGSYPNIFNMVKNKDDVYGTLVLTKDVGEETF